MSNKASFNDLLETFELVNAGMPGESEAYLDRESGRTLVISVMGEELDPPPEDLDTDRYIHLPHKNDLDLGNALVFSFAREFLPDRYEDIREIFRRKGAYRRFKSLLEGQGLLDQWHRYEEQATETALREWCEEIGVSLE